MTHRTQNELSESHGINSLGQKIRRLRRERKMTQVDLGQGTVTASMISQIEADRALPSAALLKDIADRLGVDISYFESDMSVKSEQNQMYRRARNLMDKDQYEDALPLLLSVASPIAPQFRPEVLYNDLAMCYVQLGRLQEAAEMYERVVEAAYEKSDVPTAVHAYFHLGNVARRQQHNRLATMFWQRASDLLKRHPEVEMPLSIKVTANLGRMYLAQGRIQEARQAYEEALDFTRLYHPTAMERGAVYHGLAYVFLELRDFDKASFYNDEAIDAYTASTNTRGVTQCKIHKGLLLRESGQVEASYAYLTEWMKQHRTDRDFVRVANAYSERAKTEIAREKYREALVDCEKGLSLAPDTAGLQVEMRLTQANAHMILGNHSVALKLLHIGRELLPKTEMRMAAEYARLERLIHEAEGNLDEALQVSASFAQTLLEG